MHLYMMSTPMWTPPRTTRNTSQKPPAWSDVWVCESNTGRSQAAGGTYCSAEPSRLSVLWDSLLLRTQGYRGASTWAHPWLCTLRAPPVSTWPLPLKSILVTSKPSQGPSSRVGLTCQVTFAWTSQEERKGSYPFAKRPPAAHDSLG